MRADEYKVLLQCVESGARIGIRRFLKHSDIDIREELVQQLQNTVVDEVINVICEWFSFEEVKND